MDKRSRQSAILRVISENEVETQNDLQLLLKQEGIAVGQSTLSRDIRELGIVKRVNENDVNCYYSGLSSAKTSYNSIFAQSVISMDHAQNIVVLKCRAGLANAACAVVDEQGFATVMGSIAGDDTVFILTKTENHAAQLITDLKRLTIKK
ncbi:MAG: hypothetical protein K2J80_01170 [Oscillospiraceae bacterium]|nr:hypothetical protein [Oscillospiraceae bacterium]